MIRDLFSRPWPALAIAAAVSTVAASAATASIDPSSPSAHHPARASLVEARSDVHRLPREISGSNAGPLGAASGRARADRVAPVVQPSVGTVPNAEGAYGQVQVWNGVGAARRIVAAGDGNIYVLTDSAVRRTAPNGVVVHEVPIAGARELAVDDTGAVYVARAAAVDRLADNGATTWTRPVQGHYPSPLVGWVDPYLASLTWDSTGAKAVLLFDRQESLIQGYSAGGVEDGSFLLGFPTHSYWDIDYRDGEAYVLNRAQRTVEMYERGAWTGLIPSRGALPAPAERLVSGPDGTVFFTSLRRYVYWVDGDGAILDVWDATDPEPGSVSWAADIALDAEGRLYTADPVREQVRVYERQPDLTPQPPPDLEPDPDRCQTVPDKYASPTYLRLGEKTQVTLRLDGDCPARAERADIVLLVDRSSSMDKVDASGRRKIEAAREAAELFVGLMDLSRDQVALVTFESAPQLRVPLTHDADTIIGSLGFDAYGGTDIAAGISVAESELRSARHRPDAKPIIILLTDGNPFNTTRLTTVAAADDSRYHGTTIYTIGLGEDADPNLLRVLAKTPKHYFYAPTAAELEREYRKIAKNIFASLLLKTVTIVDYVPDNMEYQQDGTTEPPAAWDETARTLTWTFPDVGFDGIEMTYWLRPLVVGEWPTNVTAVYDGTDGLDQPQGGPFPIPRVIVVAPSPTPTVTDTPEPTATGTLTPSATPTLTPSPTITQTPVTPTPRSTPTPPPSATPPDRYEIYLTILFNDDCFRRYADVVLVVDASTTMEFETPDGVLKLDAAKRAARAFLDRLQLRPDILGRHDQAAIVWYNDTAEVAQPLSRNRDALELAIDNIEAQEGTRIDKGIELAHLQLLLEGSPQRKLANTPVIVLLSDGIPNRVGIRDVWAAADEAKLDGIAIYSVGFGTDVNEPNLRRIASQTNMYYYAPTAAELYRIYHQIAGDVICR